MNPKSKNTKPLIIALSSTKNEKINLCHLPDLVLLKIFSYLPYLTDVSNNISLVCKRFYDLSLDSSLPTSLHVNVDLLERVNINQISKVLLRTVGLRHLSFNLEHFTYRRKSQFDNVLRILRFVGEKIQSLRSFRIHIDEQSKNYLTTLTVYEHLCSSLLKITQGNKLELIEVVIPISCDVMEEAIENNKSSLKFFIISVRDIPVDYKVIQKLHRCTNLKQVHFHINNKHCKASCEGISSLVNLTGLQDFVLSAQEEIHCCLNNLPPSFYEHLLVLRLINVAIYPSEAEKVLQNCSKLKEIELSLLRCSVDYLVEQLSSSKHIEKFNTLYGTIITEKGMNIISSWSNLKELSLRGIIDSSHLSSFNIINVFKTGNLHNLVRCELDLVLLDDACIKTIFEQCPKLEILRINNSHKISDNGVEYIAFNAPYLKDLSLKNCSNITDHGIKTLMANCKKLQVLNIKDTYVSQKYCDTRLFLKDVEVHCSHKKCVNFKSDVLNEYYDGNEYDDDSYSFKDYRYRR